jgi:myo-inositol-1(or 4)-monophosphatase
MDHPELFDLERMACEAGEIVRIGYGSDFEVSHKGAIDLVTDIDHRSESYLINEIRQLFPEHRIVSEESGVISGQNQHLWFIDPLDGTVNFAHLVPVFTVSIAYQQDGAVKLGVVYDPMRDEMFSAQRGEGAWLNGKQLRVSSTDRLDNSLLATGFPYDIRTHPEKNLDHFTRFSIRCQGIRRLGSAALDLCYVAAGRYDGFWELRLNAWDVAAGGLIAEEAGASVTDIHGNPDYFANPQSILAANPALHPQMIEVLQG